MKDNGLVICVAPRHPAISYVAKVSEIAPKGGISPFQPSMASRKLGSGRVLGSGKSPAPAVAAHQKNSNLFSPSDSSLSLSSQVSNSQISLGLPDISLREPLDNGDPSIPEAASLTLVCPICNENMVFPKCPASMVDLHSNALQVTLLQLNRLD